MSDVLCIGEILVDWVCTEIGKNLGQATRFTKAAGGAPANTAVGLARQKIKTAFIGRVAGDEFGHWLRRILQDEGIDVSGTIIDDTSQTRMAYVVTTADGDRVMAEFSKIACADSHLQPDDLKSHMFATAKVLHFGSISLIHKLSAEAIEKAVQLARFHKLLVSYDPNVRIGLWPTEALCRERILSTLHWADLVKINEEELTFLTGSSTLESARMLQQKYQIPLLIVTLNAKGAMFCHIAGNETVNGFNVKLVETTGAGDGFNAGVIAGLLPYLRNRPNNSINPREILDSLNLTALHHVVKRANALGALTCTKAGAIPALPTSDEVDAFLGMPTAPKFNANRPREE